jgi:integrase
MLMSELFKEYMNRYSKRFKISWKEDQRIIQSYLEPAFGFLAVEDVKRSHIELLHSSMHKIPRRANQAVVLCSSIFNRAIDWDYTKENPARRVDKYPENIRKDFIPHSQASLLMQIIKEQPEPYRGIFTFLIATGCRKNEALKLKWDEVDLNNHLITFKQTKNGSDHTFPITPLMRQALAGQEKVGDYVFTLTGGKIADIRKPWLKVTAALGKHYRVHDIRTTLASWLVQQGYSFPEVGAVLNHKDPRSVKRYAFLQLDNIRKPVEHVTKILLDQ